MKSENSSNQSSGSGSSPLLVAGAWLFVGIPLAWGVFQTAYQSVPLFGVHVAAAAPSPSQQPATMPNATTEPGK